MEKTLLIIRKEYAIIREILKLSLVKKPVNSFQYNLKIKATVLQPSMQKRKPENVKSYGRRHWK